MISIHALREEGDLLDRDPMGDDLISIHALREEGDSSFVCFCSNWQTISIHALREEGDQCRPAYP